MSCLKNSVKFTWKIIQQLFETTKKTEESQLPIYRGVLSIIQIGLQCLSHFAHMNVGELIIFARQLFSCPLPRKAAPENRGKI